MNNLFMSNYLNKQCKKMHLIGCLLCLKIVRIVLKKNRLFPNTHCLKHWKFIKTLLRNPQKQKKSQSQNR
ncbi:hypothetical protein EXS98_03605 [Helicobacter pylori]|nr:hypothetical protein [Helicobacter pylori]